MARFGETSWEAHDEDIAEEHADERDEEDGPPADPLDIETGKKSEDEVPRGQSAIDPSDLRRIRDANALQHRRQVADWISTNTVYTDNPNELHED
jgi:hypothetical protein